MEKKVMVRKKYAIFAIFIVNSKFNQIFYGKEKRCQIFIQKKLQSPTLNSFLSDKFEYQKQSNSEFEVR